MIKKAFLLNIFIIMALILAGCWNARELNALGIALIMGLDIENDKVLLTAEVIEPVPAKQKVSIEKASSVRYVQGIGNNIYEAFRDITLKFDRRLFISHNKVIIFGEEFVKRGLIKEIDLLSRDPEQRETAYLFIAKGGKAYEVMGINSGLEEIPANYILKLIDNFKYNPKTVNVNLIEYLRNYYNMGLEPMLGVIEKKEKRQINKLSGSSSGEKYELSIIGSAVFNEDTLLGYLGGNDTKGVNFIKGKVKQGIIVFPTPTLNVDRSTSPTPAAGTELKNKKTKSQDMSTLDIAKTKAKNDIELRDGKIILKTKIIVRGMVGEIQGDIDISKEEEVKELEKACSETIKKGLESSFIKAQKEFKSDILGFGSLFHRKYPKEWNKIKDNWNEIFSEADTEIKIETNIIRTGLINTPISKTKGK